MNKSFYTPQPSQEFTTDKERYIVVNDYWKSVTRKNDPSIYLNITIISTFVFIGLHWLHSFYVGTMTSFLTTNIVVTIISFAILLIFSYLYFTIFQYHSILKALKKNNKDCIVQEAFLVKKGKRVSISNRASIQRLYYKYDGDEKIYRTAMIPYSDTAHISNGTKILIATYKSPKKVEIFIGLSNDYK